MSTIAKSELQTKRQRFLAGIFVSTITITALALTVSCSKKKEATPTTSKKEKAPVAAPASTVKKDSAPKSSPTQPSLPENLQSGAGKDVRPDQAEDEVPIRLSALMKMGDVTLAGIVDTLSGNEAMVQEGNIFRGYRVLNIDGEKKTITLEKDGEIYVLQQTGDPNAKKPMVPSLLAGNTNIPSVFAKPDLRNIPMPQFEPTQDEISRGINPNDSKTWPKGYKGPTIERFLAKMTPAERAAAEKPGITPEMIKGAHIDPTDDEIARGIDPNDSDTWPSNYKGPAIEDFLAENPEEAAKLEQGGIPPEMHLQGYEATPEEAARGIDPNNPSTWPEGYRGPGIEDAIAEQKMKEAQNK